MLPVTSTRLAAELATDDGFIEESSQPFRPRARVLQILGDGLIGSDRLAVFELVKNAYDADANEVLVRFDITSGESSSITVIDDGEGMSHDQIRSVWLSLGHDIRWEQRLHGVRTARHSRLPLGEKGLGRLAAHKLGDRITLVTRAKESNECIVDIDWNELTNKLYLDEAPVTVQVRRPEIFTGNKTGTQITISELRTAAWRRGEIRRLYNQIISICSPFEEPSGFRVVLEIPGRENWIADLPDVADILKRAIWRFSFCIDISGRISWKYEFHSVPGIQLDSRVVTKANDKLPIPEQRLERGNGSKGILATASTLEGIGPIRGEFYVFDRHRELRSRIPNNQTVGDYLDESGGVRVYRDGIRVYNYGEFGDDWLGLDLRRVNVPTRRISRNIILGAIHVSLKDSQGLIEKTSREGFVENETCRNLRYIIIGVLEKLEAERYIDKDRIKKLIDNPHDPVAREIDTPVHELRRAIKQQGLQEKLGKYVDKIEKNYREMQETLLSAGISGLNLALIFHEVERGVRALGQVVSGGVDWKSAKHQAQHLTHLLDGFGSLLRRHPRRENTGRNLIKVSLKYSMMRFRHHRVEVDCPLLDGPEDGFRSNFAFGMIVGVLANLIDNALYWLRVRWPDIRQFGEDPGRRLYIGVSRDLGKGPAIVIADNGVGFQEDDPDQLIRPFFTRKPDGMGLGLYYANLAMELQGGQLVFPQPRDIEIPKEYDGAVVALLFEENP